jgi:hypothetical protein
MKINDDFMKKMQELNHYGENGREHPEVPVLGVIHEDQCAGGNRHNIHIFIRVTV